MSGTELEKPSERMPPHPHVHKEREIGLWTKEEIYEIFATEIMSISGGLFAGALLAASTDKLVLVPGLFIILPGFLGMRGNISGSLSARLTSALHLGTLTPFLRRHPILAGNIIATSILVILVSFLLGLVAVVANWLIFGVVNAAILYVAIIAGLLSNLIEVPITIVSVFQLFKRGYHPENIMGPYITTIGDIVSIAALLLAILIVVP